MTNVIQLDAEQRHAGLDFQALPLDALDVSQRSAIGSLAAQSDSAHPLQTAAFTRFAQASSAEPFVILATDTKGLLGYWFGFFETERNRPRWLFKQVMRSGPVLRPGLQPAPERSLLSTFVLRAEDHGVATGATRIVVTSETGYGARLDGTMLELGYAHEAAWATYVCDLTRPIDSIWDGLDGKVKRSIKTSERRGVTVSVSNDSSDLNAFAALLGTTLRAGGMPVPLATDYAARCIAMANAGFAYAIIARCEDRVVGGKLEIAAGDAVLSFHTAAEKSNLRCGDLLAWKEIEIAHARGYRSLDLLSVDLATETDPKQEGIRSFKAKWGGDLIETPVYTRRLPVRGARGAVVRLARLFRGT